MLTTAPRGTKDILPSEIENWRYVEAAMRRICAQFGYKEIRTPVFEHTELFKRGIGDTTDVVEKEMYTFEDRSGEMLSLRPEGTAGCVRACLEHNLIYNQEQRLWYMGPMFRHERPQKGRYRQFHQLGVEIFGLKGPDIDAEIIMLTHALWKKLGIADDLSLELNTLGTKEERKAFRDELVSYLEAHFDELDEDSKRRTHTNPLRVLDSKDPKVGEVLKGAPKLSDHFGEETKAHFEGLKKLLDAAGIKYTINNRLVRGLDYYNLTVFEWVTTALGAQGTVCGGGRYDGLVEELGGTATPAVGFGMGLERLMLLLVTLGKVKTKPSVDVYIVGSGENSAKEQAMTALKLRDALPGVRIMNHCGGGNFKRQFKRADKVGAKVAVVLGEAEIASGTLGVKDLRNEGSQQEYDFAGAVAAISKMLQA